MWWCRSQHWTAPELCWCRAVVSLSSSVTVVGRQCSTDRWPPHMHMLQNTSNIILSLDLAELSSSKLVKCSLHRAVAKPSLPWNQKAPHWFLLNSGKEPSSSNFLSCTAHFCHPHLSRRRFHTNMSILCITLGKISHFSRVLWPKKCQNAFLAPSSRTGRGHPSPDPTPLSAFGASILMLAPNHLWRFNLHAPLAKPGAPPQL